MEALKPLRVRACVCMCAHAHSCRYVHVYVHVSLSVMRSLAEYDNHCWCHEFWAEPGQLLHLYSVASLVVWCGPVGPPDLAASDMWLHCRGAAQCVGTM